jgi:hypothetical protein
MNQLLPPTALPTLDQPRWSGGPQSALGGGWNTRSLLIIPAPFSDFKFHFQPSRCGCEARQIVANSIPSRELETISPDLKLNYRFIPEPDRYALCTVGGGSARMSMSGHAMDGGRAAPWAGLRS